MNKMKTITQKQRDELAQILKESIKVRTWADNELKPLMDRVKEITGEEEPFDFSFDFVHNGDNEQDAFKWLLNGQGIKVE